MTTCLRTILCVCLIYVLIFLITFTAYPFLLSSLEVFEQTLSAHVLVCARPDTVIEWNHLADDDNFLQRVERLSDNCGDDSQFILAASITKRNIGESTFFATIKSTDCEGMQKYEPLKTEEVACDCSQGLCKD